MTTRNMYSAAKFLALSHTMACHIQHSAICGPYFSRWIAKARFDSPRAIREGTSRVSSTLSSHLTQKPPPQLFSSTQSKIMQYFLLLTFALLGFSQLALSQAHASSDAAVVANASLSIPPCFVSCGAQVATVVHCKDISDLQCYCKKQVSWSRALY